MEGWRMFVGSISGLCCVGCLICAFLAIKGKSDVPFNKVLIGGGEEEKRAYRKSAAIKATCGYAGIAVVSGFITALALLGDARLVFGGCALISGALWLWNKVK